MGDPDSIPESGRSPGEENGYPFYYPCLENSMFRGAWQATVHESQSVGHKQATNIFTFNKKNKLLNKLGNHWSYKPV